MNRVKYGTPRRSERDLTRGREVPVRLCGQHYMVVFAKPLQMQEMKSGWLSVRCRLVRVGAGSAAGRGSCAARHRRATSPNILITCTFYNVLSLPYPSHFCVLCSFQVFFRSTLWTSPWVVLYFIFSEPKIRKSDNSLITMPYSVWVYPMY